MQPMYVVQVKKGQFDIVGTVGRGGDRARRLHPLLTQWRRAGLCGATFQDIPMTAFLDYAQFVLAPRWSTAWRSASP